MHDSQTLSSVKIYVLGEYFFPAIQILTLKTVVEKKSKFYFQSSNKVLAFLVYSRFSDFLLLAITFIFTKKTWFADKCVYFSKILIVSTIKCYDLYY